VRLPKQFRLPGPEVSIRRAGTAVVLEPLRRHQWWSAEFVAFVRSPRDTLIQRARQGRNERTKIHL
jgi:virulence-associated protein VagC